MTASPSTDAVAPSTTGRRLLSSSTLTLAALAANVVASLILVPFLITHLGDRWYGTWIVIGSVLGYFTVLELGVFTAAERYVSLSFARQDWAEANRVLTTCGGLYLVAGLAALAAVLGAAATVPWWVGDPETTATVRAALIILGVDLALFFPASLANAVIVARMRFDIAAALQIAKTVVRTALILYVVAHGGGIVALAVITLATNTGERLLKIWMARRLFPGMRLSPRLFQPEMVRRYVGFGAYSFASEIAEKIRFNVDVVLIGAILGAAPVTIYNIAARLISYYMQVVVSSVGFMLPVFVDRLGKGDTGSLRRDFLFSAKLSAMVAAVIGGGLLLTGEQVIRVWIGPDYAVAYAPLAVLTASIMVELAQTPSTHLLLALGRHRYLAVLGGIEALANLALSLALILPFGLLGVALGTAIPLLIARGWFLPRYVCAQAGVSRRTYLRQAWGPGLAALVAQLPLWPLRGELLALPMPLAAGLIALYYGALSLALVRWGLDRRERQLLTATLAAWLRRRAPESDGRRAETRSSN